MKIFLTVFAVLFAVFMIYSVIRSVLVHKRLKSEPVSIDVGRSMKTAKIWIILSAVWVLISVMRICDSSAEIKKINSGYFDEAYHINTDSSADTDTLRADLRRKPEEKKMFAEVLLFCWSCSLILNIKELAADRKAHITAKGVYFADSFTPAEKYSWLLDGETLKLYCGGRSTPAEYSVTGEKGRLRELLAENYRQYK